MNGARREHLDPGDRAVDLAGERALELVGKPDDRDRQRHIGLDRRDDLGHRRLAVLEQPQDAVAGLDQHRVRLERLERSRQPTAVSLVVVTLPAGVRIGWRDFHGCSRGHGWLTRPSLPLSMT